MTHGAAPTQAARPTMDAGRSLFASDARLPDGGASRPARRPEVAELELRASGRSVVALEAAARPAPPPRRAARRATCRAGGDRAAQAHRRPPASPASSLTRRGDGKDSMWPEVGYLAPLHPCWTGLADKVLVSFGRNQAPVLGPTSTEPVLLSCSASYSNKRGQATVVEWLAVDRPRRASRAVRR